MQYNITGGNLPVVIMQLEAGESVRCESGAMSWMDAGINMETNTGGGMGKLLGRMFTGESLMLNTYTATQPGEIAFASSFPGSIVAYQVQPGRPIMAQKGAYLASIGNVEMSVGFQKKIGGGFFGGEGFLMQKFEGDGIVFFEIDGSTVEYDLQPGQRKVIDTGYLAIMDASVTLDVEMVKGVKNMIFGGEGLFNTILTGPGHITLQTMPIPNTAATLYRYMPHPSSN
ncbi:MAG: TIGR00266 family protein [Lachnospiraceae bacterium]|nr:TIGR00266 family protein [Lachnospiraceae bacterium]